MGREEGKKLNNSTQFMTQNGVTRHKLIMISDQRKTIYNSSNNNNYYKNKKKY